jgi:hypothetical protein
MSAGASIAAPVTINRRTFTNLDAAATAEAQVKDNTATRAFSAVPIKVSLFDVVGTIVTNHEPQFRHRVDFVFRLTPTLAISARTLRPLRRWSATEAPTRLGMLSPLVFTTMSPDRLSLLALWLASPLRSEVVVADAKDRLKHASTSIPVAPRVTRFCCSAAVDVPMVVRDFQIAVVNRPNVISFARWIRDKLSAVCFHRCCGSYCPRALQQQ